MNPDSAVDVLLVWWGLPWAPNDSDPLSAGSVTSAPAGPASVPIPKYGATVLSGLHVPTDHRGVRGPDADVARRHAADSAGPHPGAGFDRLMSVWHTSGKPEGTQSDQTRSAPPSSVRRVAKQAASVLVGHLTSGHVGAVNGAREFLAQALTMLPPGHRIRSVRTDVRFFVTAFLRFLDTRDVPRGGSACLDRFCQFISGAWRCAPTRRWPCRLVFQNTRSGVRPSSARCGLS